MDFFYFSSWQPWFKNQLINVDLEHVWLFSVQVCFSELRFNWVILGLVRLKYNTKSCSKSNFEHYDINVRSDWRLMVRIIPHHHQDI